MSLFKAFCPNCESAMTGGHPDPESLTFCIVCSDLKTGQITGKVWRWAWLQRVLVVNRNAKKLGLMK